MEYSCTPICFWCTKEAKEPIKIKPIDGAKPPKKAILNYEPCEDCKKIFSQGIHIIGVVDKQPIQNMPPIVKDNDIELYPTGSYFVASPDWTAQMLKANNRQEMIDEVIERRVLMMPEEIVNNIIEESKDVPAMEMPVNMEDNNEDNDN